jgi:hypothetical protein
LRTKNKNLVLLAFILALSYSFAGITCDFNVFGKGNSDEKSVKTGTNQTAPQKNRDTVKIDPSKQLITLKLEDVQSVDDAALNEQVEDYLRDLYPIISDETISEIESSKSIDKKLINDTLGIVEFYLSFAVGKNYLEEHPKILWELNIPEFKSRIYQLYNNDTLLIDTWPNVLGKPSTKTYTGHYAAFKIRNWPSWKDPESGDSVRPTPPGPNNPLGLFVVHYDENSLRYFHGTNKNYLLKNEYRALSHGCVRNDNANIQKMKEFILKKVIVSRDLTDWLDSKRSMTYVFEEEDKFPVRIIYRTFDINKDPNGEYVEFFKDVYSYEKGAKWSKFDEEELMTFTNLDNMLAYYKIKNPAKRIPDEKLIPILEKLISSHTDYQKYYLDDLLTGTN